MTADTPKLTEAQWRVLGRLATTSAPLTVLLGRDITVARNLSGLGLAVFSAGFGMSHHRAYITDAGRAAWEAHNDR